MGMVKPLLFDLYKFDPKKKTMVVHHGSCHCRAIQFEVRDMSIVFIFHLTSMQFEAPVDVEAIDCTCSICYMKRNTHIMIPEALMRVTSGVNDLQEYRFNTKTAVHMFCKHCGVCPFYRPRSNPDCYAVTLYCVAPGTIKTVIIKTFDGADWESFAARQGLPAAQTL